jgi:hypothetical protein
MQDRSLKPTNESGPDKKFMQKKKIIVKEGEAYEASDAH